jgi:hypothetical protein
MGRRLAFTLPQGESGFAAWLCRIDTTKNKNGRDKPGHLQIQVGKEEKLYS